jgi:outer membrane protein
MNRKTTIVTFCLLLGLVANVPTASAQIKPVEQFLKRYRPSNVALPPSTSEQAQALAEMIRSGQLPLTENDLVNLIIRNNLDIGANRLSPLSSEFLVDTFYRPFEPTLRLGATVTRNTTLSTSQLSGALSLSQLTHNYTVGFGQTLPTGTSVGVDFSLVRASSNSSFTLFNPSWTGLVRYSVTQHLLNNFGRLANTHQILVAQKNKQVSDVTFEKQVMDLVAQAQKSYWDLVFTAEDIKVKQRSMDLAQKTLSDNEIQVKIGTMAPIDLNQAQSEVASRRLQLVTSTYTQAQTEDQVKKLITNQQDPGMVLAKLVPLQPVRKPAAGDVPTIEEAIRIALENRPELRQLQLTIESKDIDLKYTKNQLLPTLDISASYNQNGLGGVQNVRSGFGPSAPIIGVIPGGLGESLSQLFGYSFAGYAAGFSLEIPLRNRAAQADNARAMTDKKIAENQLTAMTQQIALEVRNAMTQVEMQRASIDAAQTARELAERQLAAEQKKFDLGASTVRFVLEEQRNVAQAQTDEIAALVNYTKALVDLDHATGMTLKKNNVQIDKTLNPAVASK